MRLFCCSLLFALAASTGAGAQSTDRTVRSVLDAFEAAARLADAGEREAAVDEAWSDLAGRIPYVRADSALFLWRGPARSVAVAGDMTGWRPTAALRRVDSTDVWLRVDRFPETARLDYKLVLDGSDWRLDPANPHQQWSGFGPNSELRMPAWTPSPWTDRQPDVPRGTLSPARTVERAGYPHPVTYRVWTPAGYDALDGLATLYVTDGHEYADPRLGALPTVLDNLIADGRIAPCIAVLIDPRSGGTNRRQEQYVQNEAFASLVAVDLVAAIDADYRTDARREARTILGTSLGGLFAVSLGLQHPDVFANLAPQSPAFWVSGGALGWTGPTISERVASAPSLPFRVAMTTGTIHDAEDGAREMRDALAARDVELTYVEVPEGHSWGNWRALLDDVLVALLPPIGTGRPPDAPDMGFDLRAAPNPSAAPRLGFALDRPSAVRVDCLDARGRVVARLLDRVVGAGEHTLGLPRLAPGAYACRLHSGRQLATSLVTVL